MKKFTLFLASLFLTIGAMAQAELPAEGSFFRLKNTTSGLYMTVDSYNSGNQNAGGVNIHEKNTGDLSKQVFRLKSNGDKYHILTFDNNVLSTFSSWGFRAEEAYNNADLAMEAVEGDIWKLKGTKGYIGTNNDVTNDGAVLYSNHDAGKQNIYWMFEEVTTEEAELAASQVMPFMPFIDVLTTINNNSCFTLTAYDSDRGSWYSDENALQSTVKKGVEYNAADANQQFAFIEKDGVYYLYSVAKKMFVAKEGNGTKYTKTAEEFVTFKVSGLKSYIRAYYVVALNDKNHMGVSNDYDPSVITFHNDLTDGGNVVNITYAAEFNPSEALETFNTATTVTYEFKLNGNTLATQEVAAIKGEAYPDFVIPALPLGIVVTGTKPEGNVVGGETVAIDLGVDNSKVPFEFVESGEPTTWYYAQMHAYTTVNYSYRWFIAPAEDGKSVRTQDHKFAADEVDAHLWGFVGSVKNGFKMVNKATKQAIKSNNSGVAEMADVADATAFIAMGSVIGNEWFCMKNPAGNYLNSQGTVANATNCNFVINHWKENDGGSSFYLTKYEYEEIPVTVSELGWATMFLGEAVYVPETVNAYIITGAENDYITKSEIEDGIIPANTGVLLKNAGEHKFVKTVTYNVTLAGNLMNGSVENTYVEGTAYVLAKGTEGIGFYKAELNKNGEGNDGETHFLNNAGKAYFTLPSAESTAMFYGFDWDGTTGIEEVTTENGNVKAIYDLTGRRVEAITAPGIYIVNGKKTLVK